MTPRMFALWCTLILVGFTITNALMNWQTHRVLATIRATRDNNARVAAQISALNQAKLDIASFAREAPQLSTKLPTQEETITILSEQAKQAGVTLTFGNTAEATNGEFPVILTLSADSREILETYIAFLETSFPVISIKRISLGATDTRASATLDGIVYTQ